MSVLFPPLSIDTADWGTAHCCTYFKVLSLLTHNGVRLHQPRRKFLTQRTRLRGKVQQKVFVVEIFGVDHNVFVVVGLITRNVSFGQNVDDPFWSPRKVSSGRILCQRSDSVFCYDFTIRVDHDQVRHAVGLEARHKLWKSVWRVGKAPPRHFRYKLFVVTLTLINGTENDFILFLQTRIHFIEKVQLCKKFSGC